MKWLAFVLVLFVATATANPIRQNESDDEDWQLVPDSNGYMHLVDIRNYDGVDMEPAFDAFNDVIFRLFTRSNPTTPQFITIYNSQQLANSFFNLAHQTRLHVHGWNGGGHDGHGQVIRNAYLNRGDFNVFTIDWALGATTPNYILARNRVNAVGQVTAQFIDFLNANGMPFSSMGISGHSLGAHVAGAAGKRTTRGTLAHIVGLDPAGPLFSLDNPSERLHHTDAVYVESQVTDAGRLGFQHAVSHATFYPNWGTSQPGCGTDITGQCGHALVRDFMAESINPVNVFGAIRCRGLDDIRDRNCVVSGTSRRMGGEPIMDGPGIVGSVYFLTTNANRPFAQGPR